MSHNKSIYLYPRFDEDGNVLFQGRNFIAHLTGREDIEKNWDKYLFTAAKEVLWEEEWKQFKKHIRIVLDYMAAMNKIGETTKEFRPLISLIVRDEQ